MLNQILKGLLSFTITLGMILSSSCSLAHDGAHGGWHGGGVGWHGGWRGGGGWHGGWHGIGWQHGGSTTIYPPGGYFYPYNYPYYYPSNNQCTLIPGHYDATGNWIPESQYCVSEYSY